MTKTVYTRIQSKRDSSSNWENNNPILLDGEEIIVDTTDGYIRKKIGDGIKTYTQLSFIDEPLRTLILDKSNSTLQQAKDYADSILGSENFNEKYSTTEIVVGQWIDERPIYRKTLVFSSESSTFNNSHWAYYNFTIEEVSNMNMDYIINIRGMASCYSDQSVSAPTWQPIPRICPDAIAEYSIGVGDLNKDIVGVLFGSKYTNIPKIYLNIDYVKNN